jgi:hypothetical protein
MHLRRSIALLAVLIFPFVAALDAPAAAPGTCTMSCCLGMGTMVGSACPTKGSSWQRGCPGKQRLASAASSPELVRPPRIELLTPRWGGEVVAPRSAAPHAAFTRLPEQPPRA